MSSYRKTRGVDVNLGQSTSFDDKRAQWGMITAGRVLECLFPEESLDDGNSVESNLLSNNTNYTPDTLAQRAKDYFINIYQTNQNGVPICPDIEDFCMFARVSRLKFMEFSNSHDLKMNLVANNIRNSIAACKKQMALNGEIPPVVFAIDFNNNHDYVQSKNQVQIQTSIERDAQDSIDDIASRIPIDDKEMQ